MKLTKDNFEKRGDLNSYTGIDRWSALELLEIFDGEELSLNGLEELTPEIAAVLECHTYRLELNGLKSISDEVAEMLSRHEGDLSLDGVQELSSVAAEHLSRHDGDYGLIFLAGLKRLTNERGHVLLAKHLASSFDSEELSLDSLEVLEEEPARKLVKHECWLYLNGLTKVSEEVLRILSKRRGGTSFKGMVRPEGVKWSGEVEFKDTEDDDAPPPLAGSFADPVGTIVNSVGMKFVPIPAGYLMMGSPEDCPFGDPGEEFQHRVRITKPFMLGMHQVTQAQYQEVTGENPSFFEGPDRPVEHLTWKQAQRFCEILSARPAEVQAGRCYRMPTEAEWEYACRAGTTTPFNTGDELEPHQARVASTRRGSPKQTAPVGSYPPNAWGLFDMHGNVWEWTNDWFSANYYQESPVDDPQGPLTGTHHTLRGGSASVEAHECRSAIRGEASAVDGPESDTGNRYALYGDFGVRVVCVAS